MRKMENLGLRRHSVRLVEHDPSWAASYAALAAELAEIVQLEPDRIAHVGSTAVQGMPAKPILDIAVRARGRDHVEEIATRLAAAGYVDRGDGDGSIGRLVVLEPSPSVRAAHIHILEEADPHWDQYHTFLRCLLEDREAREAYARLKRRLAQEYAEDRRGYTAAKAMYVTRLLANGG